MGDLIDPVCFFYRDVGRREIPAVEIVLAVTGAEAFDQGTFTEVFHRVIRCMDAVEKVALRCHTGSHGHCPEFSFD